MKTNFGVRTTCLDDTTSLMTFDTEAFIRHIRRRTHKGQFQMILQNLPTLTPGEYSHRIFFDVKKFLPEEATV